jgi:hypothetical protein
VAKIQLELRYLSAYFKRRSKREDEQNKAISFEDIRLRSLVLREDYRLSLKDSFRLAKIMQDDDTHRIETALNSTLNRGLAKKLIKENPHLFLMDNGSLERFTTSLYELTKMAEKYNYLNEFDPEKNPAGFASFEAIHETREKISKLEKTLVRETSPDIQLRIMISNKALERAEKDSFVIENKEKYLREIKSIAHSPLDRKKREKIGDFSVSPTGRSRKGFRVAWHYDGAARTLFIDDLLYHVSQYGYVDSWNDRANKEININYYRKSGYKEFNGEI